MVNIKEIISNESKKLKDVSAFKKDPHYTKFAIENNGNTFGIIKYETNELYYLDDKLKVGNDITEVLTGQHYNVKDIKQNEKYSFGPDNDKHNIEINIALLTRK